MTDWTTGLCRTRGADIHYLRTGGAKPPLVMLHGLIGSGACWSPVARALEDVFDIVMPDARGHGGSSAPAHGYLYDDHAADVAALMDELGLAAPVLMGHSMGGMTAALTASRLGGRIAGLVLVDPTFLTPERQREVQASDVAEQHRRLLGLSKEELAADVRARHPHRTPEIAALLAEARLRTSPRAFDVLTPPNPDHRELVAGISVPILLVIGDTPVVSLETARELEALNPRLRVAQIEKAGHGLPYDRPDRLAAMVRAFLMRK